MSGNEIVDVDTNFCMIIKIQDIGFQLAIFRYKYVVVHCHKCDDVLQAYVFLSRYDTSMIF